MQTATDQFLSDCDVLDDKYGSRKWEKDEDLEQHDTTDVELIDGNSDGEPDSTGDEGDNSDEDSDEDFDFGYRDSDAESEEDDDGGGGEIDMVDGLGAKDGEEYWEDMDELGFADW